MATTPSIDTSTVLLRLEEDAVGQQTVQARLRRALPEPREIPIDTSTLALEEVTALLGLTSPEAPWRAEQAAAEEAVGRETTERVLRRIPVYARDAGIGLSRAIAATEQALSELRRQAEREAQTARAQAGRADRRLQRSRERPQESRSPGLINRLLGVMDQVVDRAQAVKAWNDRERAWHEHDLRASQQAVWEQVRTALQILPQRLDGIEAELVTALQETTFAQQTTQANEGWPASGITWEPVGPVALSLTAADPNPRLPADLLVVLSREERSAADLLERDARKVARRHAALLPINSLGEHPLVHRAGQEMLRSLNRGAGERPHLFQLVERGPDGESPTIWPAVQQQTDVVAIPGPAIVVGFLRIDRPVAVADVQGTALEQPLAANPFVRVDLARRYATVPREERGAAGG